ncbi:hypothetical protein BU26DRAFT_75510 [Trematosphaeria pertusa]|uniref:Uncharacterized protein n=1 Tax=Trematosphaeria pertusa TaxID=390896 RepID=A0A6A6I5H2_9PLEO|nr:uncharacterized protein BU26DRAFT_75510 [Trematosphaeria pertusa]KAF2245775.1 hypothetical protein BU26DRAFT_75510 [Trematosphaeria pertusa]
MMHSGRGLHPHRHASSYRNITKLLDSNIRTNTTTLRIPLSPSIPNLRTLRRSQIARHHAPQIHHQPMHHRPRLQDPQTHAMPPGLHPTQIRLHNARAVHHALGPAIRHTAQRAARHGRHRRGRCVVQRDRVFQRRRGVDVEGRREVCGQRGLLRGAEGVEGVDCPWGGSGGEAARGDGEQREARIRASVVRNRLDGRCAAAAGSPAGEVLHLHRDGAVGLDVALEIGGDARVVQRQTELHGGAGRGRYADRCRACAVWHRAPVHADGGADRRCAAGVAERSLAGRDADVWVGRGDCEGHAAGAAGVDVDGAVLGRVGVHAQ